MRTIVSGLSVAAFVITTSQAIVMNNEMDDNETLSITAWEKKNPKVRDMCSKKAGWK